MSCINDINQRQRIFWMSIFGSSEKALEEGSEISEILLVDSNQDGLDMRDTLRESVVDQGKE